MTLMLPNHHLRSAGDIRDHIRATLPPTTGLDWMPITGIDAIDALRTQHRRAALKLADAIHDVPASLAAASRQIADHDATLVTFRRESYRAAQRGETVPRTPAAPNVPGALDAAWAPIQHALAAIEGAVRAIVAEVGHHSDEMERRYITPATLRGEVYFGSSGGDKATPREIAEGARDGSILLELSYLERLVSQWRSVLDPPALATDVADTDLSSSAITLGARS